MCIGRVVTDVYGKFHVKSTFSGLIGDAFITYFPHSICRICFINVRLFCILPEHQAALLQLKRECKEELEKMHVSFLMTAVNQTQGKMSKKGQGTKKN